MTTSAGSVDICNLGTLNISTENTDNLSEARNMWRGNSSDDDMCQIDDNENLLLDGGTTFSSVKMMDDFNKVLSVSRLLLLLLKVYKYIPSTRVDFFYIIMLSRVSIPLPSPLMNGTVIMAWLLNHDKEIQI